MDMISARGLVVKLGHPEKTIVREVSFAVSEGDWLMIVGPNGAGKSTVVKALSKSVPYIGSLLVEGAEVSGIPSRQMAKKLGVLSQSENVNYSFTVREVVALGRYSYSPSIFSGKPADEEEKIAAALESTGLTALANQSVLTLSGGEVQRVFLAQLLAQDPDILVLDEPSSHLDLVYQKQIFELISAWLGAKEHRAVVSVVHDLSLAKRFGTKVLMLHQGRGAAFGEPDEVLTAEKLSEVYGMDVQGWMREMLSQWQQEGEDQ